MKENKVHGDSQKTTIQISKKFHSLLFHIKREYNIDCYENAIKFLIKRKGE